MPPVLTAYRLAGRALAPFAGAWLALRARSGKEDFARLAERFGHATRPRPQGALVWLHGASVGEARVLLSLRDGLALRRPDLHFLITTGTRTSADIIARDHHPRTLHQFTVLDDISFARRFLDHWRPDLGVFAESEVWPNLLIEAAARGAPLALVNASMSASSLANWARAPETARRIFSCFALISAADHTTAASLEKIAGKPVTVGGNLKLTGGLAAPDAHELEAWRKRLAGRPVWIAASTHAGEEEILLAAHAALRWRCPDALLIIAPRHPERGPAIAALAANAPRRALGQSPAAHDPIYVADTLGELSLFFAAAPVVFMGGSLVPPLEGHNPIEPTLVGAAVIAGPFTSSFAEIYDALEAAAGVERAGDSQAIAARVEYLLTDEHARDAQIAAARAMIAKRSPGLAPTVESLLTLMDSKRRVHAPT